MNVNNEQVKPKQESTNSLTRRIISPEKFDELVEIVDSQNWLSILTLAGIIFMIILWSIFGKITINIKGKGIIIYPRQINDLESSITGKIEELRVNNGDCLEKDEVIAIINPSDIKQELEQEKAKLIQLQAQDDQADLLSGNYTNLYQDTIAEQKASKQQKLAVAQDLTPLLKEQGINAITQQKSSIEKKLATLRKINPQLNQKELQALEKQKISLQEQYINAQEILPVLKDRWQRQRSLLDEGALSEEQVLQAEQEYRQAKLNISELQAQLQELEVRETEIQQQYEENLSTINEYEAQLKELEVKETEAIQKYEENLSLITQLRAELKELDSQEKKLLQTNLQDKNTRKNEIQETEHNIARLQKEYADNREIKSPVAGCILELTTSEGEFIQTGDRLGAISLNQNSEKMIGISYFQVGDGKKIETGMNVQITPDTVKRERFGGIMGVVTEVSPFPITQEGAINNVGNSEIIATLGQGALIEVKSKLEPNKTNFSGYQWSSSQGPNLEITSGTTTTVHLAVEQRRPITFVLPILREWTGI